MGKITRNIDLAFAGLRVREAEDGEKSRTIEGHAVVFNQRSVNLTPWSSYREVYEVMEKGSITQDLINRSDVVLTAFHNNEIILGRSVKGKGTLTLTIDDSGVLCRCVLAETAKADEILSGIERGDITGMSFAYTADEEDSENGVSYEREEDKDGKEIWLRHVKRVNGLYDVTIAGHPAYPQTDIAQREIDDFYTTHIGEPARLIKQREQEEEEKRLQKEREEKEKAEQMKREMERRKRNLFLLTNKEIY